MSAQQSSSLIWFRQDLRLADNPAFGAAVRYGLPIVALYVLDDETPGKWRVGGASRWWLHQSLVSLQKALHGHGVPLLLRRGRAEEVVSRTVAEAGAKAVFWNRCYEPSAVARDTKLKSALQEANIFAESHNAALLAEPWTLKTAAGTTFRVFTPFWNALRQIRMPPPAALPKNLRNDSIELAGDRLEDWNLLPDNPDWAREFRDWSPGEDGAQRRLTAFLDTNLARYRIERDKPGREGVSRLSPHLHWGEISPRQIWHAAEACAGPDAEPFLRELGWREFSYHLLWQFPDLPEKPFNVRFSGFPWREDPAALQAWQRGTTGYPIVDAGMRQLWKTGWMHNRVRMVVASFLVKHLLLPWQAGEAWFWDTLVDADLANNAASWQWVAGSGADAAPYFRVFNPVLQGEKFDSDGAYVRRWVPELAAMPDKWIHKPWIAPNEVLSSAGVSLGANYPHPLVVHETARRRALDAFSATAKARD